MLKIISIKARSAPGEDYVFYYFECMQETEVHVPNYICAMHLDKETSWEFKGKGCVSEFVWTSLDKRFTFLGHNTKGYDSYFILKRWIKEKMVISTVTQGGKLMCSMVGDLEIRFIDSLNFLAMKLSNLPNQKYVGPMPGENTLGQNTQCQKRKRNFWTGNNTITRMNLRLHKKLQC